MNNDVEDSDTPVVHPNTQQTMSMCKTPDEKNKGRTGTTQSYSHGHIVNQK